MSKISNENYFTIQGFMVNDLNLKGNELLVYAIIYCFSQTEEQKFTGSLQYLADWTNSTRRGILKNLQSLVEKQLIVKEDCVENGAKKTIYRVKNSGEKSSIGIEQSSLDVVNSVLENGELSSTNNKIYKNIYNIPPIVPLKENSEQNDIIDKIIDYMNFEVYEKTTWLRPVRHNYKNSNVATRRKIKARLDEGYTIEDFKDVIFYCYREWVDEPVMFKNGQMSDTYYRPSTMFNATNFENYLESYKQGLDEQ